MVLNLPPLPDTLKPIQRFLAVANQFEQRDVAVTYWSRLYALQLALKLDRVSKEGQMVATSLLEWLEKEKANNLSKEIRTAAVAKAHLEDYAVKLLDKAYKMDLAEEYGKPIIHLFYTAGVIFDVLLQFGDLSEEISQKRKYAKWKTIYISNCLKNGEAPVPGPPGDHAGKGWDDEDEMELQSFLGGQDKHDEEKPGNDSVHPSSNISPVPSSSAEGPISPSLPSSSFVPAGSTSSNTGGAKLTPEQTVKAQKYCKWAESALSYDDEPAAIGYLTKALKLLQTGQE